MTNFKAMQGNVRQMIHFMRALRELEAVLDAAVQAEEAVGAAHLKVKEHEAEVEKIKAEAAKYEEAAADARKANEEYEKFKKEIDTLIQNEKRRYEQENTRNIKEAQAKQDALQAKHEAERASWKEEIQQAATELDALGRRKTDLEAALQQIKEKLNG